MENIIISITTLFFPKLVQRRGQVSGTSLPGLGLGVFGFFKSLSHPRRSKSLLAVRSVQVTNSAGLLHISIYTS